jgi:hypothetical protein
MNRIVSWNCQDSAPVRHNDVLPLAGDPETSFLQGMNRLEMIHAGQLGHVSHLDFSRQFVSAQIRDNFQILRYRLGDIL